MLPLSPTDRVVVTGPSADSMTNQLGGWSVSWQGVFGAGHVCCMGPANQIPPGTTVLKGIQAADPNAVSAPDQASALAQAGTASAYVVAKILASMAITVPSIAIVLLLGRFYGGVHMELWKWFAVGGTIWIGSLTFTALAVALGYRFMPDSVQPMAMFVYFVMSILGGLWFALTGFLAKIGHFLPTYQITRIGTDLISNHSVPATAYITILAWFAGFIVLAVLAVRGTAETV